MTDRPTDDRPLTGGCACGAVRYALASAPLVVHVCHCTDCQRESGTAFATNALIEGDRVHLTSGTPDMVITPSESGRGQEIARCPGCRVALWSHYAGAGRRIAFVRVGTLDTPAAVPPDIHIFTRSIQPWVVLPSDVPAFEIFYRRTDLWRDDALARYAAAIA